MSTPPAAREVLRPSPLRWLAIAAVSAGFCWLGVAIMPGHPLLAWACIAFFGPGVAVALVNLLPGASGLVLDEDGFEIVSLFRHTRVAWGEVAHVGATRAGLQWMVGFDFVEGCRGNDRMRRVNRSISGFQAALPDTYGLKAAALAVRMNARLAAWRERSAHAGA